MFFWFKPDFENANPVLAQPEPGNSISYPVHAKRDYPVSYESIFGWIVPISLKPILQLTVWNLRFSLVKV